MATFKPEIQNKRADGTYNVRIRITHKRVVRRISTNIYVTAGDLTRGLKIKNQAVLDQCEDLVRRCREACNAMGMAIDAMAADELAEKLDTHLKGGDRFHLDFVQYTRDKAAGMKKSTGDSYLIALNCLLRYIHPRTSLDIMDITTDFLQGYENFIKNEPSQQGSNRKAEKEDAKPKSGRAVSAYLACIRAIHNLAKKEFNKEDRGVIRIPYSPFKNYDIKPQPRTRKRGLTPETMQAIIDLPYESEANSRYNLAKDCFILSFALIGMNSVDMFYAGPVKRHTLVYNRRKTADRRDDNAEMRVRIHNCLSCLMEKYKDPQGERLFNFHRRYSTPFNFNKALNTGLKQIGENLGLEKLEFYAARHSWATIARSSDAGVDKATVHEALNHVSEDMAVTDIYIDRDWSVVWNANNKVLSLFDWSAVGFDVL